MSDSPVPQRFSFAARDVILNMTLIESFGDGIYTAIFWFTMYMLVFHKRAQRAPRGNVTFLVIIPLYILAMIHVAIRWTVTRRAFVVDGSTAERILESFLTQPMWCNVLSVVSFALMVLIADVVMVWRCWTIWGRNWKVAAVPFLLVVVGTAFCIMSVAFQIDPKSGLDTDQFNKFAKFGLIYFVFSLCSTLICTSLIVYRIISVGRVSGIGKESPYRKILEIIVESAVLYCIALIIYLPFLIRDDFSDGYPQAILTSITGIAPTIITARVALGVSRDYTPVHHSAFVVAATVTVTTDISKTVHDAGTNDTTSLSSMEKVRSDYEV